MFDGKILTLTIIRQLILLARLIDDLTSFDTVTPGECHICIVML